MKLESRPNPAFSKGNSYKEWNLREKIHKSASRKIFGFLFPSLEKHVLSVVEGRGQGRFYGADGIAP